MLLRSAEAHSQAVPAASVWDRLYYFHAQADRTVWDGVYVHPQADRGEVNFANHCASCHQGVGRVRFSRVRSLSIIGVETG